MNTFSLLIVKLAPLYILIALGYISAKYLKAQKETVGKLLLYIITPVIVFYAGLVNEISIENVSLPFVLPILAIFTNVFFYFLGTLFYPDNNNKNLLAYGAGAGNTGYFGLPVIAAVLGDQAFSLAVIAGLGMIVHENSIGFFLAAKGNHSTKKSFLKILMLPHLYALAAGLLLHRCGFRVSEIVQTNFEYFKGSYTLLGMMIIGMGLANLKLSKSDFKFVGLIIFAKFVVWPLSTLLFIYIDRTYLNLFSPTIYSILIILSSVPLAANSVVIASELNLNTRKAALAVLVSTILALFFIPLIAGYLNVIAGQ